MDSQILSTSNFFFPLFFLQFLILVQIPPSLSNPYQLYLKTCGTKFSCGTITGIGYPFRGQEQPKNCGYPGLVLNCKNNNITTINIMNLTYRVLGLDQTTQVMKIAREDVMESTCPQKLVNTTLDYAIFDFASQYPNITYLFGCPTSFNLPPGLNPLNLTGINLPVLDPITSCGHNGVYVVLGALGPGIYCNASVIVPVFKEMDLGESTKVTDWDKVVRDGFEVRWKVDNKVCSDCTGSNGQCGYDVASKQSTCYCPDPPYLSSKCPTAIGGTTLSIQNPGSSGKKSENVTLPIGLAIGGTVFICVGLVWFFLSWRQKKKQRLAAASLQTKSKDLEAPPSSKGLTTTPSTNFSQSIPSYPSSKSDLENASTYFGAQVFTYAELEEATENFDASRELGDGGFGTVYYGKLKDGRIVAVKRLYENNFKRVEQFVNEVRILTTLRHENLVTLHGCTSKRSRELLLVYEYISNGTVADHLHGKRSNSGLLSWPVRLNIAIETAEALAYLHASDVIHRDVKTNNILLENDFHVKVADFGLSRLFPNDVTHVSTAPQGTPGYVDPEYYQCYQLTEKSDVYSFGVVLVELISSKQAVDTNRHRHDINLANMAVNKIQNHTLHELVDPSIGFETDSTVRRMATLVAQLAFRCLQQEKDMRPSMGEVLEALKGIKNEEYNAEKAEIVDIVDIMEDDVGLLKANPPPFSPDSHKWVSSSTTPNSSG
ncbi:LEAF RUST 10 DISEASE-RESISTANCE LOCUS RECEPTOR-LIKE PROTEIN KINASE-like 1.4 isoform X1 [Cornus florida]|uniref:LEAF RUST 10 DISEASE-RESISTANCE LOCUS RECEPTOR-LIKE PROTEIN KINASE-like 1.4 isoform X1 n=1 Tax=Cornus florida TaxID=4283 RepID=UPI0028A0B2A4|nr:LEAF RUST 10 DISEASE-RESISTANCE LOCUS RECEPTOR-LIKE PROTEIN KINASE-like 1.4 isoform X1 [Cornus florida]